MALLNSIRRLYLDPEISASMGIVTMPLAMMAFGSFTKPVSSTTAAFVTGCFWPVSLPLLLGYHIVREQTMGLKP